MFYTFMPKRATTGVSMYSRWYRLYNNQFFDYLSEQLPKSHKEMFRWCEVVYHSNPSLVNGIRKLINYQLTEFVYKSNSPKIKKDTEELVEDVLDIRSHLLALGLDYYIYGNVFRSIYFPFTRFLACPLCHTAINVTDASYKMRRGKFILACSEWGNTRTTTSAMPGWPWSQNTAQMSQVRAAVKARYPSIGMSKTGSGFEKNAFSPLHLLLPAGLHVLQNEGTKKLMRSQKYQKHLGQVFEDALTRAEEVPVKGELGASVLPEIGIIQDEISHYTGELRKALKRQNIIAKGQNRNIDHANNMLANQHENKMWLGDLAKKLRDNDLWRRSLVQKTF